VALYEKMLGRFLELKVGTAQDIRSALVQGDVETASRCAHSMIAVAGTIGAGRLSDLSRELQDAIQSKHPESVGLLLTQFEENLATVVEALKNHLGRD
jgi:HPt (histidine-containing phosphotransfer) domain-containing protein